MFVLRTSYFLGRNNLQFKQVNDGTFNQIHKISKVYMKILLNLQLQVETENYNAVLSNTPVWLRDEPKKPEVIFNLSFLTFH